MIFHLSDTVSVCSGVLDFITLLINPLTAKFPMTFGRIAEIRHTNYPIHKTT